LLYTRQSTWPLVRVPATGPVKTRCWAPPLVDVLPQNGPHAASMSMANAKPAILTTLACYPKDLACARESFQLERPCRLQREIVCAQQVARGAAHDDLIGTGEGNHARRGVHSDSVG